MEQTNNQKPKWYVAGTLTKNKEMAIRDHLREDKVCCYVPLKYDVKVVRQRKQRTLVPAISGLLFVRGTLDELKEYFAGSKYQLYLRKSTFSRKKDYLTVKDEEMENFMRLVERATENICYYNPEEVTLKEGDRIVVRGGMFDGVEGYITRIAGKRNKQLVVSIPEVTLAAVTLSPEMIELKGHMEDCRDDVRSKDVVGDTKRLTELSKRLLFSLNDLYCAEDERNLTKNEMRRIYKRLNPMKGIIAELEGRIALALYLAAAGLNLTENQDTERLLSAIERLKDTCLLKLEMKLYYAYISKDEEVQESVREAIVSWGGKYSKTQREIKDTFDKLFPHQ